MSMFERSHTHMHTECIEKYTHETVEPSRVEIFHFSVTRQRRLSAVS